MQPGYVGSRDAADVPCRFLLPHLRPGLDILDAGWGVGAIALDLAATVEPGRIVDVDVVYANAVLLYVREPAVAHEGGDAT